MRLILLGAPGSGKGTIAAQLTKEYGVAHISTGDIFRANIKNNTPLGVEAKSYIDQGLLVPDSLTISMLFDRISQDDCKNGFMLDGFPRTIFQAEELDKALAKLETKLDVVISITISDEEIKSRVSSRRVCSSCGAGYNTEFKPTKVAGVCDECGGPVIQRDDDKPETVLSRLKTYYEKTQPLSDYYLQRGLILEASTEISSKLALEEIRKGLSDRKLA